MRAKIDGDGCIGCGLCAETCPEVFRMAENGLAEVHADPVPPEAEAREAEAQDSCPVSVIEVSWTD